jgi:Sap, sulfolipid-1-addressing protein
MWGTVFVLALLTSTDPVRFGLATVLISRPRPIINLFLFWLGGMATGIFVALAFLLQFRKDLPFVMEKVTTTLAGISGGATQIAIGVLALVAAAVIATSFSARQPSLLRTRTGGPAQRDNPQAHGPTVLGQLWARTQKSLQNDHLWMAFVAGLGSATPPVEYLIAIATILASGRAFGTQICAAVMFTVVVLAVVEVPLVCYVAIPAKTQTIMLRLQSCIQMRRRQIFASTLAVAGAWLLTKGAGLV